MNPILLCAVILLTVFYLFKKYNIKDYVRNTYYLCKIPGPPMIPLIGWTFKVAFLNVEDLHEFLLGYMNYSKHLTKAWIAGLPLCCFKDSEDLETFMSSTQYITKGAHYEPVKSWLNTGLLTSTGSKWHTRRKQLTPAFHFKILEDALPAMNKNSKIFVQKALGKSGKPFEIKRLINLCTLDVVCEAAMGIKLDAQNENSAQYVNDIAEICEIIMKRNLFFWLNKDITFYLTPTGFRFKKVLNRLHTFTENVIKERKKLYIQERHKDLNGKKKKKAFLDCMIELELENPGSFTPEDMREEVDTFLFEGHDTTSAAIVHCLMFIGCCPEVQEKLWLEMDEIFEGSDRDVTSNDLLRMKYLEQVIKETLRLLPSVPIMQRFMEKDFITRKGVLIPKLTNLVIFPQLHHLDANYFPDPYTFDPERFSEERLRDRPPFAYIPFSAGPRNCIGQKFAMMELKVIVSTAVRYIKFKSVKHYLEYKYAPFLIIRATEPIFIEKWKNNWDEKNKNYFNLWRFKRAT